MTQNSIEIAPRLAVEMERRQNTAAPVNPRLLDFHFRAGFLQLLLGGVGVSLVRAFQHGLRSAFDQRLGFRQTEPALTSRTALMAAIFLSAGAETRITSNVSFAAAAGAAAPPAAAPPAAATATGAAAVTPHLVSSCFTRSAASNDRQLAQFFHDVCDVSHIAFLSVVSSSAAAPANFSSRPANRRFTLLLFVCFSIPQNCGTEIVIRPFPIWP